MLPDSCDELSEHVAMASTSRVTAPSKRRISGNLDAPTREFLDNISSTDSEDNFYSLDFIWKVKVRKTSREPDNPVQHNPLKMHVSKL